MSAEEKREPLFSVTAADCEWEFFPAGSKGGQHANKVASAARCTHRASGAVGEARDTRYQLQNRKLAFGRMAATPEFTRWLRIETARRLGHALEEERVRGRSSDQGPRVRTYNFAKKRVTDHRTGIETQDVAGVMDGKLDAFIDAAILAKGRE